MNRKKLYAFAQVIFGIGVMIGLLFYQTGKIWPSVMKVIALACAWIAVMVVIRLLGRFKILDLKKLDREMAHSWRVNKLPQAKIAIAGMIFGVIAPFLGGTLLFADRSKLNPRVWVLDQPLILKCGAALGISLLIFDAVTIFFIFRWTTHRIGRAFLILVNLLLTLWFWFSYLTGEPGNLVFVGWALGLMCSISTVFMSYRTYLDRITPVCLE